MQQINDTVWNIGNYAKEHSCTINVLELTPAQFIYIGFATFIMAIIIHELAHWITINWYSKKPVHIVFGSVNKKIFLGTGQQSDYDKLDTDQKGMVYMMGISAGLVVIMLSATAFGNGMLLILAPYLLGITKDLKLLYKCMVHRIR